MGTNKETSTKTYKMPKRTKKEMKSARWEEFQEACLKYTKVLFVEVDNVTSKQICVMRKMMREIGAKMIMGKNTHMKAALYDITQEPDPRQTQFFQALNIATKIQRAQIEIVNPVTVITEGDKISQSQAPLLDRLKICT